MANSLYGKGRQKFIEGGIAWLTDTINCALVDNTYACTIDTHEFWSTVQAKVVGTPQALASKSSTSGIADSADVTFTNVTGTVVGSVVLYKDTGAASTSPLIAYYDTGTGLPVTPNGGNITVSWPNSGNYMFKL